MIASFFFSLLAGLLVVHVEPPLKALVEKNDRYEMRLDPLEFRVLTFALLLLCAAIATWAVGADSSAYLTVAGGLLGYFASDLYAFLRDPQAAEKDDPDDWDGDVREPGRSEAEAAPTGDTDADDTEETLAAVRTAVQQDDRPEEERQR
ncbi:hypothetical protein [Tropicimonas sp. IMCC6043]|uniref:hypothetical protein n=1 Tax=Tropicimonas sp. IMCC6043 TaxID=2510645 RepID=UPI00101D6557|nr:hypothetical protein [Tropicimonas sp. IMCC6043]RYH10625.1 hypothetical protein EU800_07750 [Tropicimonas sp. IMCC6043]